MRNYRRSTENIVNYPTKSSSTNDSKYNTPTNVSILWSDCSDIGLGFLFGESSVGLIYLLRNKVNDKGYVGKTNGSLEERIYYHKRNAMNGETWILSCAIRKYGWESFECSILYQDNDNDRDWMDWWERRFIKKLGTKSPGGYNMTDGGDGGAILMTEQTRKKIGEAGKGRKHTDEAKKKISEATKGKKKGPLSIEAKDKISAALVGRPITEEHKRKISESKKGRPLSEENRKNLCKPKRAGTGRKLSFILSGRTLSEEHKRNIGIGGKGKKHKSPSLEGRKNQSEAQKKYWAKKRAGLLREG